MKEYIKGVRAHDCTMHCTNGNLSHTHQDVRNAVLGSNASLI